LSYKTKLSDFLSELLKVEWPSEILTPSDRDEDKPTPQEKTDVKLANSFHEYAYQLPS